MRACKDAPRRIVASQTASRPQDRRKTNSRTWQSGVGGPGLGQTSPSETAFETWFPYRCVVGCLGKTGRLSLLWRWPSARSRSRGSRRCRQIGREEHLKKKGHQGGKESMFGQKRCSRAKRRSKHYFEGRKSCKKKYRHHGKRCHPYYL